jgi:hypothetical protein
MYSESSSAVGDFGSNVRVPDRGTSLSPSDVMDERSLLGDQRCFCCMKRQMVAA